MLTLLLLKACFYLDLKAQTKQLAEVDTLVHNIMFVATMLPNGLDRQQITLNINNSLTCLGKRPYDKYFADLTECNQLEQPNRKSIDDINVSRLLAKRFKVTILAYSALDRVHDRTAQDQGTARPVVSLFEVGLAVSRTPLTTPHIVVYNWPINSHEEEGRFTHSNLHH
jgi:hypothetical protein